VAHKHRLKFLLAPSINGWVTLFPSGHGQDEQPSHSLAALLPEYDILHVVMHDDDVFAYGFFRKGRLIDEYNSLPDYFGEVSQEERDRQRGLPERFADLLGPALGKVEEVLHTSGVDAMTQFERFAELLHLPNAATAYEYLADEETDGIVQFEEFLTVPDPAVERAAKRQKAAELKAQKKELQAAGLLLAEYSGAKGKHFAPHAIICTAGGSAFFLCWALFISPEPLEVQRLDPRASSNPVSIGLRLDPRLHALAASRSGRYMMAAFASGKWAAELWDLIENKCLATLEHPAHSVSGGAFSADETLLVTRSNDGVRLIRANDGAILGSIAVPGKGRMVAIHPSKRYAVVDGDYQPVVVDLDTRQASKRLLLGGKYDIGRDMRRQIQFRLAITTVEAHRALLQLQLEEFCVSPWIIPANEGKGNESLRALAFSDDGRWLLVGTNVGARAYDWQAVLSAVDGGDMPEPIHATNAEPVTYELGPGHDAVDAMTNGVAYDPLSHSMLFVGFEGTIRSLNLQTGEAHTLIEVPGRPPISDVQVSVDATVISILYNPVYFERTPKTPWTVQLWRNPSAARP